MTVAVPCDALPGKTKLSVKTQDGTEIQFLVPHTAVPGALLEITRNPNSPKWECRILDGRCAGPTSQNAGKENVGYGCPKRVVALITPDCVPGESVLCLDVGEGQKLNLRVPKNVLPGDKLVLTNVVDETVQRDSWVLNVVREKVVEKAPINISMPDQLTCHRAPPLDSITAFQNVVDALRKAGGHVSEKLGRGLAPEIPIPGIVALEPIEPGEELCRVQSHLHITPATVQAAAPSLCMQVAALHDLPKTRHREVTQAAFTAQLLTRASDRDVARHQGTECVEVSDYPRDSTLDPSIWKLWECYADQLVAENFTWHPYVRICQEEKELRAKLCPSSQVDYVLSAVKDVIAIHSLVEKEIPPDSTWQGFGADMFLHAWLCHMTRKFKTTSPSTLVPVLDLFNHSSDAGLRWIWDDQDEVTITAIRHHKAGEELFLSYGPLSNVLLYSSFGFTLRSDFEPSWTYVVMPNHVRSILDIFLPSDFRMHTLFLESRQMEQDLGMVLKAIEKKGQRASEFIRVLCMHCKRPYEMDASLRPALDALQRHRRVTPSRNAWWEALEAEEKHLLEVEEIRIKMCEYLCLVAHIEAINAFYGHIHENDCLEASRHLRSILCQCLRLLQENRSFSLEWTKEDAVR